jgi:Effector protein
LRPIATEWPPTPTRAAPRPLIFNPRIKVPPVKSAWAKARARYMRLKQHVADLLQKERPAEKNDLMRRRTKTVFAYDSVAVRYPAFPMWLFRFDDLMKMPLAVSINSYRFQREKHQKDVIDELVNIHVRKSGQALFKETERTGMTVYIEPYWSFGKTAYKNDNALFEQLGPNATAEQEGDPDAGGQSDSLISFTPSMWGKPGFDPTTSLSTGTSGISGPGSEPDEVLFHEMVHATRYMHGVSGERAVNKGYENQEEFFAVVLANIYLAEKGRMDLRASHHGHHTLMNPLAFLENTQNITPTPRVLMQQLHDEQRRFFKELGSISERVAWWNPVRSYGREIGVIPR